MGIYNKLATIQTKLAVPKDNTNSFGKYNYRSCEDILKKLKPLCDENGCVCYLNNELEHIGEFNYVKATATLVDLETGEVIKSTAHAREEATKKGVDGSQITGASSSYARKYALAGMFCIDNEKDSDATNDTPKEPHKSKDEELAELKTRVLKFINAQKFSADEIKKIAQMFGKVDTVAEWDLVACKKYIKFIEGKGGTI